MAYLPYDPDKDQQSQQGQQQGGQQQPPVLGAPAAAPAQGTGGAGGTGGATQPTQQGQATRSGSWTNLQSYIGANQGNDAEMGQQVRNNVDTRAQQATTALGDWSNQAKNTVQQNTVKTDQSVVQGIQQDPTRFIQDQSERAKLEAQRNAKYRGPQSSVDTQGYMDTRGQFQKVGEAASAAGQGYRGAQQLVTETFQRPTYSRGERSLDSFILGAGQGGQQALQGIKQDYGTFGQQFSQAAQDLDKEIQTARDTTANTAATIQNALKSKESELGTQFDQLGQQAKARTDEERAKYALIASGDERRFDEISRLTGIDQATLKYLKDNGYNFSNLAKMGSAYNANDLASDQQTAQYRAILDLLNKSNDYDFSKAGGRGVSVAEEQAKAAREIQQAREAAKSAISGAGVNQYQSLFSGDTAAQDKALQAMGMSAAEIQWLRANGVDPAKLAIVGPEVRAGQVGGEALGRYSSLAGLLGLAGDASLDPAQVLGNQHSANAKTLEAARSAARMQADLQARLDKANKEREALHKAAIQDPTRVGISQADIALAQKHGIPIADLIKATGKVGLGDVVSDKERAAWADMMNALGVKGGLNLSATGAGKDAFSFDRNAFERAMAVPRKIAEGESILAGLTTPYRGGNDVQAELRRQQAAERLGVDPGTYRRGMAVKVDPAKFFAITPTGYVFDKVSYDNAIWANEAKLGKTPSAPYYDYSSPPPLQQVGKKLEDIVTIPAQVFDKVQGSLNPNKTIKNMFKK